MTFHSDSATDDPQGSSPDVVSPAGPAVQYTTPAPNEPGTEASAGTGQFPHGAANRDEASGDAWKPARASDRLEPKNEASLHAYSWPGSLSADTTPEGLEAPVPGAPDGSHDCSLCGCQTITDATDRVLYDVGAERERQEAKFPGQTLPDSPVRGVAVGERETSVLLKDARLREQLAKERVRYKVSRGELSWADVLDEEAAEAYAATDTGHLREELVQVAAVAVRWVEDLDRRFSRSAGVETHTGTDEAGTGVPECQAKKGDPNGLPEMQP